MEVPLPVIFFPGAIYKDQCPIQPNIPIFLIVTGVTHLAALGVLFVGSIAETCGMVLEGLIGLFSFAWFIVGKYCILGPVFNCALRVSILIWPLYTPTFFQTSS